MSKLRLLSVPLIGIAAMIIASEYISETSVTAVVNAPLATIRAPIEGTLTLAKSSLGSLVSQGEPLGEIEDLRADSSRLRDLERTKTGLTAELAKIEQSLATSKKAHADFATSAARYQEGRVQQLTARLNQEQDALEAANARLLDLNNAFVRAASLSERGIQTAANLDHARSGFEVAKSELEAAHKRVSFLKVELEAAKLGTFLGELTNDAPYSLQRERDLKLKIGEQDIARAICGGSPNSTRTWIWSACDLTTCGAQA